MKNSIPPKPHSIPPKDYALLISNIRRAFSRSQLHRQALNNAISKKKGPRGGRQYDCNVCGEAFGRRQVDVDHIKPVVPFNRRAYDMKLDTYVRRLWCHIRNLQVLCKECHKKKTAIEKSKRRKK